MDYYKQMTLITVSITNAEIILGLIGNLLSFIVFSRKPFAKSSINIYCRAIAVFDSFGVVYVIFTMGSWITQAYPMNKYTINCKLTYLFVSTISPISGWIVVAFSIDQLINVSNNIQRLLFIRKRSFQLGVVAFLALFHLAIYLIIPISLEIKNVTMVIAGFNITSPTCALTNIPFFPTLGTIYLVESSIIPFFIMIITTVCIIRKLKLSTHRLSMLNTSAAHSSSKRVKQRKFALNSVALSVIFVSFTSPIVVQLISPSTGDFIKDAFLYRLFSIFFYLNYSIHFLTHYAVNSIFRREFLNLFRRVGFKQEYLTSISTVRKKS